MAVLALVLVGVWLAVVAGLRPFIYARRGGDVRVLRPGKRRGAAQRWAGDRVLHRLRARRSGPGGGAPGVGASLLAIEIQVRWAEEPYLQRVHGSEWREYAARTGRFVPGLGRVRKS